MAFRRDTYYQALYERLQAKVPGIVTWSRRHLHFSRLTAASQPACLVLAANQDSQQEAGAPRIWTLGADIVIWVRATGQEDNLDTVLNDLVDAVELALKRDIDDAHFGPFMEIDRLHTSLGGLVSSLYIAGPVELNQREGAEEASVVIPIDMIVLGDSE